MSERAADDPLQRVAGGERIAALDVLRGIAILGILLINIGAMGGYVDVGPPDPRLVSWAAADQAVFRLQNAFLEGTQRGLLELLFGAGVMIMTRKAMRPDGPVSVADLHYRRNLWLVALGLVHAFVLLWPGDILFAYGIVALLIFPFRLLKPGHKALVGAAFILLAIVPGAQRYQDRAGLQAHVAAAEAKIRAGEPTDAADARALDRWAEAAARLKPLAENPKKQASVAHEQAARLGPLGGYAGFLAHFWARINLTVASAFGLAEYFGTMLLGMALFEWGVLQGRWRARGYLLLALAGYGLGAPMRWLADGEMLRFSPAPEVGWITWDIARIALTLGHVGLVNLVLKSAAGARALGVFAAPGRMPLTIYFSASAVCMWGLFPGVGLGLFGQFGVAGLAAIALAVIAGQLVFANLWMRAFETGPADWVWKTLAYGRRQPFWRGVAVFRGS